MERTAWWGLRAKAEQALLVRATRAREIFSFMVCFVLVSYGCCHDLPITLRD
jgi:hypothetical protein